MAIKTIKYTLSCDGVNPAFERSGGLQYDHKKTQLQFNLAEDLYDKLIGALGSGVATYRFDCYDGEGKIHLGETKTLNRAILEPYELEYWVTKFGGKIKVCVVITISSDGYTQSEFYNGEVVLKLTNLPMASVDKNKYQSMSTLAVNTKNSADIATVAMQKAETALEEIKKVKFSLENAEWIFDGNQTDTEIDVDFVVESDFDNTSCNALANKTITNRFAQIDDQLKTLNNGLAWQTLDELVDAIKGQIFLEAHPVGSFYWSMSPESPEVLFGGKWEQIKNVFVFAAGDIIAGSIGGEKEHVLTQTEMPKHYHGFFPENNVSGIDFVVPTKTTGTGISSIGETGNLHSPGHWASQTWGTTNVGGSMAHNNMPPYIAAYCWQRVKDEEDI